MAITISGTTGIAGVDGSAGTPAVQGTDTNTGVFFPAADTIAFTTGGTEDMRIDSSGNVGIGTSSPSYKLDVTSSVRLGDGTGQVIARINGANSGTNNGAAVYFQNAGTTNFAVGNYSAIAGGAYNADALYYLGSANNHIWFVSGSEKMRIDTSGNLLFNSGYGSVATAYGCRAWVNFNGAATPITINASGNVSTIGDIGVGIYQINFSSAMPDANYAVCSIGARSTTSTTNNISTLVVEGTYTTSSVQVFNERSNDGTQVDSQQSVMVVR